jgi:2-keto-4-pentenoate hydratase/2-oxohepta-3-ene-1,7-dioic acid hydratase in catechol pathway
MRLATYSIDGRETVGLVRADGRLVELVAAFDAAGLAIPPANLLAVIELADPDALRAAAATIDDLPSVGPERVTWLPPVRRPSKVVGIVVNNKALAQAASFIEDHPIFFVSPPSALNGHGQPVVIRPDYGLTHPEAELGVVIGRRTKSVGIDDAVDAVFGYTIVNDVTSVTLKSGDTVVFELANAGAMDRADGGRPLGYEHGDMQLTYHARSKGTDTFTPCGPWIVTRDEVPDPSELHVNLYMGGELCMQDHTGNLTYGVAEAISHVSHYCTLEPGDILHMGTAATGRYKMRELDFQVWDGPCTVEIEGIGALNSPVLRTTDGAGTGSSSRSSWPSAAE